MPLSDAPWRETQHSRDAVLGLPRVKPGVDPTYRVSKQKGRADRTIEAALIPRLRGGGLFETHRSATELVRAADRAGAAMLLRMRAECAPALISPRASRRQTARRRDLPARHRRRNLAADKPAKKAGRNA